MIAIGVTTSGNFFVSCYATVSGLTENYTKETTSLRTSATYDSITALVTISTDQSLASFCISD